MEETLQMNVAIFSISAYEESELKRWMCEQFKLYGKNIISSGMNAYGQYTHYYGFVIVDLQDDNSKENVS